MSKFKMADLGRIASQTASYAKMASQIADTFSGEKNLERLELMCAAMNGVFQAKKIPLRISIWKEGGK